MQSVHIGDALNIIKLVEIRADSLIAKSPVMFL